MTTRSTSRGTPGVTGAVVHATAATATAAPHIDRDRRIASGRPRRRECPADRGAPLVPVFRQHREPDVITPASADLHVASRISFALEAEPSDKRQRPAIARLHVGLDAVQLQLAEGE